MRRAFLWSAALYNAAWMVFFLVAPERVFRRQPPGLGLLAVMVGALGVCFAVNAVRVRKPLLAVCIVAKLCGPLVFVAMVLLGCFEWSQAWLPLVNDLIWIPGLVGIYRAT
jgi:hypothetical protein